MTFYRLFDGFPYHLTFDHTQSRPRADGKEEVEYRPVYRAPTEDEYEQHLRGERPIVLPPLREDCTVVWGAIDVDIYGADDKAEAALKKALRGTTGILFRTKSRGFHFIMFSEPVAASKMRAALELVRSRFPKAIRDKSGEIFPKQTSLVDIQKPSAMNLPCFGSAREIVEIWVAGKSGPLADGFSPTAAFDFAYREMRLNEAQIDDLAQKNGDRLTRGRPVEQSSPVGFKEPKDAAGRQEHLFKVGSSMRARGAEMQEIEQQLFELDKHYAEISHPLWEGKGRIDEKRIRSALKQIAKFEKGTPSGLHYDQVAAFNNDYAILDIDGTIEFLDVTSDILRTYTMSHFKTKTATRRVKIGNRNVPIADLWIVDADRREYDGIVIEPTAYDGNKFNLHRGFAVTPKEGDPSLFLNYIRNTLCDGDLELARWVEHYLADMVQRPTEPSPPTAIVIRGPQGQGKSFLFRFMKRIMGPSAQEIADSERLFSRFNREIAGVTLIGAEEAIFSGDSRLAQILKTFISSHEWMYEAKHKATVTIKNVHRLIATTNSEHAALIDRDDRRLTIIGINKRWDLTMPEGTREANSYWQPYYDFMDGDGPAIVLHHLLSVEVDQDLIRYGHITEAKADDKIMSDPVLAFLDEVAETMILPHDLNATGCASMASIMDKITKDGGMKARGLSAKAVSNRIRELVPTAEPCRKGIYVTQVKLDMDGFPEYPHQTYQRGLDFGDPHEFRKAVSKVTQRDYGDDAYWVRWQISVGIPKDEPWREDASDELESITR